MKTIKTHIKDKLRPLYRKFQQIAGQIDFVPSGHFYSPIANDFEINEGIANLKTNPNDLLGINLNLHTQLEMLQIFERFYKELPFSEEKQSDLRYYFNNQSYCHSDGICLYSMIRYLRPKRIIEIGSGFSSCLMHDVNDLFFGGGGGKSNLIAITHIEPYPKLLRSLLYADDLTRIDLYEKRLQEIDLGLFENLESNDIVFVDSTHVSKINSDVNKIFFEILPRLKSGVHIHFHDIFYPFSYPAEWLKEKRSWNEAYMLRAFLEFNTAFEIVFFNTCLHFLYPKEMQKALPLSLKNTGGSIWIKRK